MAVKEKVDILDRKSRILEVLNKDYKWETYLYIFVSLFLIEIGTLILTGVVQFKDSIPLVGTYPKGFAIAIVVIGALCLIYALFPFFKTAYPEVKKTTWPSWTLFFGNAAKTFVFLIAFTLIYFMFDIIIGELLSRYLSL
ncbi:MAG: preprotein translocase subunit SecE [Acholeplasmatales bacterium]|nr:preprotein translocase subunit SecE [Acholeplasmatales bacterium]